MWLVGQRRFLLFFNYLSLVVSVSNLRGGLDNRRVRDEVEEVVDKLLDRVLTEVENSVLHHKVDKRKELL
jgi:hypothetical protein